MPSYGYKCVECEVWVTLHYRSFEERNDPVTCATCGKDMVRDFSNVAISFKGSGFHKNDYRS